MLHFQYQKCYLQNLPYLDNDIIEILENFSKEEIVAEVAEGLALTQADKFKALAESVEFTGDEDDFRKKLTIIKENAYGIKTKPSTLFEEVELDEEEEVNHMGTIGQEEDNEVPF